METHADSTMGNGIVGHSVARDEELAAASLNWLLVEGRKRDFKKSGGLLAKAPGDSTSAALIMSRIPVRMRCPVGVKESASMRGKHDRRAQHARWTDKQLQIASWRSIMDYDGTYVVRGLRDELPSRLSGRQKHRIATVNAALAMQGFREEALPRHHTEQSRCSGNTNHLNRESTRQKEPKPARASDIKYIAQAKLWLYLAVVLDCTRRPSSVGR